MDAPRWTKVPENPEKIFDEIRKIDLSRIDLNTLSLWDLTLAIEWVFFVWNDWIDHEWYWTDWGHWGAKTSQRNLAFTEFLDYFRIMRRWNFKEALLRQLPALSHRCTEWQIQDIGNLLHLYFMIESIHSFKDHLAALMKNQGDFYRVDRAQFNHNWFTWHGAGPNSEKHDPQFSPVGLRDVRSMRII